MSICPCVKEGKGQKFKGRNSLCDCGRSLDKRNLLISPSLCVCVCENFKRRELSSFFILSQSCPSIQILKQ